VQAKERRNTQFKIIVTHSLGDGPRPISECFKIHIGADEALFLQMKPHLVTKLKLVRNLMLVMSLLILGIGLIQDIMNLFLEVLHPFNEFGFSSASL
jgi:hypothetical protein